MKKNILLLIVFSILLSVPINNIHAQDSLFIKSNDTTGTVPFIPDSTMVASITIQFNASAIKSATNSSFFIMLPAPGFPNGISTRIEKTKQENKPEQNTFTWYGKITGQPGSFILFTVKNNIASGHIRTMEPGNKINIYRLNYIGNNLHRITRIAQQFFKGDRSDNPVIYFPGYNQMIHNQTQETICYDTAKLIDVLVVYTTRAKEGAGGTTAIEAEIETCIQLTNTSFENSLSRVRIRLADAIEANYAESDAQQDRDRLQNKTDDHLDNVHTFRNDKKADVVILLVENGGGYSGYSFRMETVSPDFSEFAFGVVQRNAAISNLTFPHEFGHIIGARHDCAADGGNTPFAYSHGYFSGSLETIMSTNASSTRLEYWSNPNVLFAGTTVATGTNVGTCRAFNVLSFENTVDVVSKFRCKNEAHIQSGCPLWSRCFWIILITSILIICTLIYFWRRRR